MTAPLLSLLACLQMVASVCCGAMPNQAPSSGHDHHSPAREDGHDMPAGCHATLGCAAHRRDRGEPA